MQLQQAGLSDDLKKHWHGTQHCLPNYVPIPLLNVSSAGAIARSSQLFEMWCFFILSNLEQESLKLSMIVLRISPDQAVYDLRV